MLSNFIIFQSIDRRPLDISLIFVRLMKKSCVFIFFFVFNKILYQNQVIFISNKWLRYHALTLVWFWKFTFCHDVLCTSWWLDGFFIPFIFLKLLSPTINFGPFCSKHLWEKPCKHPQSATTLRLLTLGFSDW